MAQRKSPVITAACIIAIHFCLLTAQQGMSATFAEAKHSLRMKDYDHAVALLSELAATGDADAQYQLASLYRSGLGVGQSTSKCFYWLELAAQQGHVKAQYNLGAMFENGRGTQVNFEQARRYYQLAADAGNQQAKTKLESLASGVNPDSDT